LCHSSGHLHRRDQYIERFQSVSLLETGENLSQTEIR
jgi:hypothetical protein